MNDLFQINMPRRKRSIVSGYSVQKARDRKQNRRSQREQTILNQSDGRQLQKESSDASMNIVSGLQGQSSSELMDVERFQHKERSIIPNQTDENKLHGESSHELIYVVSGPQEETLDSSSILHGESLDISTGVQGESSAVSSELHIESSHELMNVVSELQGESSDASSILHGESLDISTGVQGESLHELMEVELSQNM